MIIANNLGQSLTVWSLTVCLHMLAFGPSKRSFWYAETLSRIFVATQPQLHANTEVK